MDIKVIMREAYVSAAEHNNLDIADFALETYQALRSAFLGSDEVARRNGQYDLVGEDSENSD